MKIPFLNLVRQIEERKGEIEKAIGSVLRKGIFILGPKLSLLEKMVAKYVGKRYAVGVGSGTDALHLALRAKGIGKGDGVITTPYTFFATAEAISLTGARPFFVDIELDSYNLDGEKLADFIEKECREKNGNLIHKRTGLKIRAIIPVHLFGQCAKMERILDLARRYNLSVIEDAAQSFGAEQKIKGKWLKAGSMGEIGCFSFYPTKNLWAFGDGGMIVTSEKEVYHQLCLFRNHGMVKKNYHSCFGWNSRLDEIQAALLLVNFRSLKEGNQRRKEIFLYYNEHLKDNVIVPKILPFNRPVFNQYVIRTLKRDFLRSFLERRGIATEVYYPLPLHLQKCYRDLGYKKGDFPKAEKASEEVLALPIDPTLKEKERKYIVDCIAAFFADVDN
ncbi:MAG: DegT/DnrJ/EryC1/StrS family aminotransferase [candidate division WOR-3 bacterium]